MNPTPIAVINQLNAYNKRDIDAFIINFSDDCEIYDANHQLIMKGRGSIYQSYKKMFDNTPDLHCKIKSRIVIGEFCFDEEEVIKNNQVIHCVAIYTITNEIITKVVFYK
jgi:hypothetical protein